VRRSDNVAEKCLKRYDGRNECHEKSPKFKNVTKNVFETSSNDKNLKKTKKPLKNMVRTSGSFEKNLKNDFNK